MKAAEKLQLGYTSRLERLRSLIEATSGEEVNVFDVVVTCGLTKCFEEAILRGTSRLL